MSLKRHFSELFNKIKIRRPYHAINAINVLKEQFRIVGDCRIVGEL